MIIAILKENISTYFRRENDTYISTQDGIFLLNEDLIDNLIVNHNIELIYQEVYPTSNVVATCPFKETIFLNKGRENKEKTHQITIKNGHYHGYLIDVDQQENHFTLLVSLDSDNSLAHFHSATLTSVKKHYDIKIVQNGINTSSVIENYGVVTQTGQLQIKGVLDAKKGAKGAKGRKSCKILCFDKNSIAHNEPILLIGEKDIEMSHASALGTIDPEIVFYFQSRGISIEEAKMMISLGYLLPIMEKVDISLRKEVLDSLKGRIIK